MTEVVTSNAAFQQLNLLAPRQQAFVVERESVDAGFASADAPPPPVESPADSLPRFSNAPSTLNPVNQHADQQAPQPRLEAPISGPSKARIEIKHIDLGLTPSEVVGTPDILQRFDANGDRRVDLIEAARAGVAREGVFTFAGLAVVSHANAASQPQPAPVVDTTPIVADSAVAFAAEPADEKLFTPADLPGAAPTGKFHVATQVAAAQLAAQGTPAGVADAPKKFYGDGAEVVVGKFAVADTVPRFVDDTAAKKTVVVTEDGTGETKVPDKVAQTDTDQPQGKAGADTADSPTYDKARRIALDQGQDKKVVLVEVAAYADASAITAAIEAHTTAVTA